MMFWFFVLLIVGIVIKMSVAQAQADLYLEDKTADDCPPHKWVYVKQQESNEEYMKCSICNKIPGTESGEL